METNRGTPSFVKGGSNKYDDSRVDHDCDFTDDMIDEHVGISSAISSPQYSSQHSSLCKILTNFDNSSKQLHNNDSFKDLSTVAIKNYSRHQQQPSQRALRQLKTPENSQRGLQLNVNEHMSRRQKKIKDLKQELEQKEMQQCTFTPNSHLAAKKKRNLVEFLKNQSDHVAKISQKNEETKRKVEQAKKQEQSFKPKINKANNLPSNFNKKPAHERLYELKQNRQVKNIMSKREEISQANKKPAETSMSFKPVATDLSKKKPVPCLLYEKAERRQQLARSISKSRIVEGSQRNDLSRSKSRNKLNDFYGAQKLIKEYCTVLEKLNMLEPPCQSRARQLTEEHDQIWSKVFSLQQFNEILHQLGFLLYNKQTQCESAIEERCLAAEGYRMIQVYGLDIKNICVFLLAVNGIFSVSPDSLRADHQSSSSRELKFSDAEGRRVQSYFDLLYRNRLVSQSSRPAEERDKVSESSSAAFISPRHEQHTRQLASKYRSKMVERANERFVNSNIDIVLSSENQLTHEDLLVIDRIGKTLQLTRQREERQKQLDEQCTFHPQINGPSMCSTDRGREKSNQLYEQAKIKSEFEKCKKEHKISDISHSSTKISQPNKQKLPKASPQPKEKAKPSMYQKSPRAEKLDQIKDVRKTIARMTLGRKQRETKTKFLQRGEPEHLHSTSAHHKSQKSNSKSAMDFSQHNISTNTFRQPTLYDESNANGRAKSANKSKSAQSHSDFGRFEQADNNEPFLVIDVNMGNQVGQIIFNAGDEKRVGLIVDDFCTNFDLDEECKSQLLQLVQVQMSKYLNNVGIESTGAQQEHNRSTQRVGSNRTEQRNDGYQWG